MLFVIFQYGLEPVLIQRMYKSVWKSTVNVFTMMEVNTGRGFVCFFGDGIVHTNGIALEIFTVHLSTGF